LVALARQNKFCFALPLIATLRSPKKRSLLGVNEHFEGKRNAEITLLDSFFRGNVNTLPFFLQLKKKKLSCVAGPSPPFSTGGFKGNVNTLPFFFGIS